MNKKIILIGYLVFITGLLHGQSVCLCDLKLVDSLFYKNGEIYNGNYDCFDEKGKIKENGSIIKGILDSSSFFDGQGNLTEIVWFKNNEPDKRRLYRNATATKLIINLKGNVEHGLWERYSLDGRLIEQKYYDNGQSVGLWTTWDKYGEVLMETDFTNDPIVTKYHGYKKGKHTMIIYYNDKKTGKKIKKEKIIEYKVVAK